MISVIGLTIPHRAQSALWKGGLKHRFVCNPAGRRSGKTEIALAFTMYKAISTPPFEGPGGLLPRRYGLAAPIRLQAREIWWERLKRGVPRAFVHHIAESRLSMTLMNGNVIEVWGMERPQRIEGRPWDGWILDEFANMRPEAWFEHVRPSIADRGGYAWKIGVPQGRNHFWDIWNDYQIREECVAETWKSREILDAINPGEVEQLARDLDARTFRQEMEASFEEAEGRIYYAFDRQHDVHEFPLKKSIGSDFQPWVGGIDFNVDPLCAVRGWETMEKLPNGKKQRQLWIWDEVHIRSASTLEAAKKLREDCQEDAGHFGKFILVPDPTGAARHTSQHTGQTDHAILRAEGFSLTSRNRSPSRRDRYNSTNSLFCNGIGERRGHIHPRCKYLIRALEGLLYKEGSNEPDKKKSANLDHPTDALGYLVEMRHQAQYSIGSIDISG